MLKDMKFKSKFYGLRTYETAEKVYGKLGCESIADLLQVCVESGENKRQVEKNIHRYVKDLYTGRETKQEVEEWERRTLENAY